MNQLLATYAAKVSALASSDTTGEDTYYSPLITFLSGILKEQRLPDNVREKPKERRIGGGLDRPDVALYDGGGDFIVVPVEVKLPKEEIHEMAHSDGRNDQVGRYLARCRVLILCNVRGFGLLTISPSWAGGDKVPPEHRTLTQVVELWPSETALRTGRAPDESALTALLEMVAEAVTMFAPLAEPESVARVLARQARRAKAAMPDEFGAAVKGLAEDFGQALGISFEGEEGEEFFRSSLVQTVFYGLFAGWTLWRRLGAPGEFRWRDVPEHLKIPFLGDLFYDIGQPSRIKDLGLAPHLDLAEATLKRIDTERFFAKMALPTLDDDAEVQAASAITYFYEPFLEAFDPELRKQLGVWYTPPEIVRYQVHKVHRLLQEELGMPLGLADERVVILDPCCGTGAYLIETLQTIANTLREEGVGAEIGDRLRRALTRRVIGFEILTAPFVIAHLQLYLLLQGMHAEPQEGERLAVFLTNALTGWDGKDQMKLNFPELQQEHDAAREVKAKAEVIVVIGNPPYNRFAGSAILEEADLVDHYKGIKRNSKGKQVGQSELFVKWKVRKQLLDDLYVRFFRLAEKRIGERAKFGIVSFISNNRYLTGRSYPMMRESLLHNFADIWVDNLHGYRQASERTPWGTSCETTFAMEASSGIKVGTAIVTYLKRAKQAEGQATIHVRDFYGRAAAKRKALLLTNEVQSVKLDGEDRVSLDFGLPRYEAFKSEEGKRWKMVPFDAVGGYEDWPALDELFIERYQGVNPNRGIEDSITDTNRKALVARMQDYYSEMPWMQFASKHPELAKDRARYKASEVRDYLNEKVGGSPPLSRSEFLDWRLVPYMMFPLDSRFIYYETRAKLINERRQEMWDNLDGNEFFAMQPEPRRSSAGRPIVLTTLFDLHLHEGGTVGFPVFTTPNVVAETLFDHQPVPVPKANLSQRAWNVLREAYGLSGELTDEDARRVVKSIFRVALAVRHAPQFEREHRESLAQDWMHLPIPKDPDRLAEISEVGNKVALLLDPLADPRAILKETVGDRLRTVAVLQMTSGTERPDYTVTYSYYGGGKGRWEPGAAPAADWPAAWGERTGDLYLNSTTYLQNVPERIWKYELGGYPVIKKWLGYRDAKRRPGMPLTLDEVDHLQGIVRRLAALHLLHPQLDALYEQIGGDAFTAEELGLR